MNAHPLLTIGIPTWNRAGQLATLLESIAPQMTDALRARVEILVSDNGSTDATAQCVSGFAESLGGCVRYRKNETNLGFSRNVDLAVRNGNGEFVLLMGDDDALEPGAIEALANALDKYGNAISSAFIGSRQYDSELRNAAPDAAPPPFAEDRFYANGIDYLRETRGFPSALLSGTVVRKSAWIAAEPERFLDTISIHALCMLRILENRGFLRIAKPYVKYRADAPSSGWASDPLYPFSFYIGSLVGCRSVKASYPPDVCSMLYRICIRSIIFNTVRQKILRGQFNKALVKSRLRPLAEPRNPLTWLAFAMLEVPRWMLALPFRGWAARQ